MYPNKKKEEYIASRLAREALEDVNYPKQIAYEDIRPHFTKRGPYRTKEDLEEVIQKPDRPTGFILSWQQN